MGAVGARMISIRVAVVRTGWRCIVGTEDGVLIGTVRCRFIA